MHRVTTNNNYTAIPRSKTTTPTPLKHDDDIIGLVVGSVSKITPVDFISVMVCVWCVAISTRDSFPQFKYHRSAIGDYTT